VIRHAGSSTGAAASWLVYISLIGALVGGDIAVNQVSRVSG
jgi:hypothetical protein